MPTTGSAEMGPLYSGSSDHYATKNSDVNPHIFGANLSILKSAPQAISTSPPPFFSTQAIATSTPRGSPAKYTTSGRSLVSETYTRETRDTSPFSRAQALFLVNDNAMGGSAQQAPLSGHRLSFEEFKPQTWTEENGNGNSIRSPYSSLGYEPTTHGLTSLQSCASTGHDVVEYRARKDGNNTNTLVTAEQLSVKLQLLLSESKRSTRLLQEKRDN